MLQVEGLSIAYGGQSLFEEAMFSLQKGEKCGLVGRNGSGKSTLFRLLMQREVPDSGTLSIPKNYTLGMLDQHIAFSQPTLLQEAALGLRPDEKECLYKAEAVLFGLGFKEEDLERPLTEFSGGFQLRVHLAKVLISEPDCLLLDEPTNYLDIISIRWFKKFLQQWRGEFILISHDREFMDSVTTHTLGIHRHKVLKVAGDTVKFYEQIIQQEEVHERTRQNLEKKRAHAQSFIERFGAKATKAAQAQSRAKMLARLPVLEKLKDLYQLDFSFKEAPFPGKRMLEGKRLSFAYPDAPTLIHNLSVSIDKGERIAIIGKNGYGKSTLLRMIAGELAPESGDLNVSENVRFGYFGQTNIDRLNPAKTIEEEISEANPLLKISEVKSICGLMLFSGSLASKTASVLSGGEKSRVLLGKILAAPCNLLLLDEPTHHLDMESIEALIDALEDFSGSIVIVTHSELILKRLALNKIIVCRQYEQELFLGDYETFLEKGGWQEEEGTAPKKQKKPKLATPRPRPVKSNSQARHLEELLTGKERELYALEQEMVQFSAQGHALAIKQSAMKLAALKKEIDELYLQLDKCLRNS